VFGAFVAPARKHDLFAMCAQHPFTG
jgi:hypothetical protein